MIVGTIFLGLFFLVVALWCFKNVQDSTKLFAVFIFGLFLTVNGIGIAIPATVTNSLTDYSIESWWLVQCGLAYIPIALAAIWVLLRRGFAPNETPYRELILRNEFFWILALVNLIFFALTLGYMLEDGFDKIRLILLIDSNDGLYQERYSFDQEQGHGWFASFIIYRFLGLLTTGLILVYAKQYSLWIRYATTLPLLLITLMRSATELQRGPVITHLLLVSALIVLPLILRRRRGQSLEIGHKLNRRTTIVGSLVVALVVGLGLTIFQITHEHESALISFPRRIFVIPAHTASLYFGLFPDAIPFRGIASTFIMPLGDWSSWQHDSFNLKEIGYVANGYPHHPNANFIASSYSAFGWLSVALTSSAFIGIILWFNSVFARVDSVFPALATIITFHGTYAVVQVDFLAAMIYGFGISQLLMVGAAMFCLKYHRSATQEI